MKRVEISAYDVPEDVARCVEAPDVGAPSAGEVVFEVLAFPINPADVAFCIGRYRLRPPLPAVPGAECVGRVIAIGAGVDRVAPGDLVINLQRENWAQRRRVRAEDVIVIPPGIDLLQAAMLRTNPPTARLLLTDITPLTPGSWLIQNAANSAVGRLVVTMARARGLRTVNVVRRQDASDELAVLGGDVCLIDGPDLGDQVKATTAGAAILLGLDAVSGDATARIAACVADDGHVCNYGSMSGEDPRMPIADLLFRGVSLTGFMLGRALATRSPAKVQALYAELARQTAAGDVHAPVDAVFPIEDIRAALIRAQEGGRAGKVLVTPNGPI